MNLRGAVQTYLAEALGIERPAMRTWPEVKRLPRYLAEAYAFGTLELWGKPLLCMMAKAEAPGMTELHKHLRLVEQLSGLPVVLVLAELAARQRARLVELFLPFVVPGKQLFLPPLGLDLREQYALAVRRQVPVLEPATQAALLAGLLGGWTQGEQSVNASTMSRRLGYSAMSMSRAGRELLNLGFLLIEGTARAARWRLAAPAPEVWRKAEPMLRSPVCLPLLNRPCWCRPHSRCMRWAKRPGRPCASTRRACGWKMSRWLMQFALSCGVTSLAI